MAEPQDWRDRIVGALGAVVIVALAIGAIIGVLTYTVVRATGLDSSGSSGSAATPPPAQQSAAPPPKRSATPSPTPTPTSTSPTPKAPATHKPAKAAKPTHHRHRHHHHALRRAHALTLSASPRHVRAMGRVNLYGSYPGHNGSRLAVQRLEGGHWSGFPVSVTVRGGHFRTWVASGRHGVNKYRVVNPATHAASGTVSVFVG